MIKPEDLPEWTDDPVDRLRHTLKAFEGSPDEAWALVATSNAIPGISHTGLTWGDLRMILAEFDDSDD